MRSAAAQPGRIGSGTSIAGQQQRRVDRLGADRPQHRRADGAGGDVDRDRQLGAAGDAVVQQHHHVQRGGVDLHLLARPGGERRGERPVRPVRPADRRVAADAERVPPAGQHVRPAGRTSLATASAPRPGPCSASSDLRAPGGSAATGCPSRRRVSRVDHLRGSPRPAARRPGRPGLPRAYPLVDQPPQALLRHSGAASASPCARHRLPAAQLGGLGLLAARVSVRAAGSYSGRGAGARRRFRRQPGRPPRRGAAPTAGPRPSTSCGQAVQQPAAAPPPAPPAARRPARSPRRPAGTPASTTCAAPVRERSRTDVPASADHLVLVAVETHPVPEPQHRRPPARHQRAAGRASPWPPRCSGTDRSAASSRAPQQVEQHRQHRDRVTGRLPPRPSAARGAANTSRSAAATAGSRYRGCR